MYRFLLTRKWIILTLVILVAIPLFLLLSRWQFNRLDEKQIQVGTIEHNMALPITGLTELVEPDKPVSADLMWRIVEFTGTYDSAQQVLVRKRPMHNKVGFWVLTPMNIATSEGNSTVWVNRGWMPPTGSATTVEIAPPAPSGEVQVRGRLRPLAEDLVRSPDDLPQGQVADTGAAVADALAQDPDRSVVYATVELVTSSPAQEGDLSLIPPPETDEGPHLSYAIQWITFTAIAFIGWWILVRREVGYQRKKMALAQSQDAHITEQSQ